jgi:hypothetical protein
MGKLLQLIDKKIRNIRGLNKKQITYSFDKHFIITEWLRRIGNVSHNLN